MGDLIGPDRNCNALLTRLRQSKPNDLSPKCIYGWWEDQFLAEKDYCGDCRAESIREDHSDQAVRQLIDAVDDSQLNWLASLQYGFIELDCALIHGSSADVTDQLTQYTSPLIFLDQLTRLDVNRLFTARGKQQFRLELKAEKSIRKLKTTALNRAMIREVPKWSVIGIGSGRNYTLDDPASDHIKFLKAGLQLNSRLRGFS